MIKKFSYFVLILLFLLSTACGNNHSSHSDHAEDDHHDEIGVEIEPEQANKYGILIESVRPSEFKEVIKVGGEISPSSEDVYTITARKNGIVRFSEGITVGSQVTSGEKIAVISSEGLQGGDLSEAAQSNLASRKSEYERLKRLYDEKLVTLSSLKEAEMAYNEAKALATNTPKGGAVAVTVPASGSITSLLLSSGSYVETGDPIAVLSKNSRISLRADLPVRYSRRLPEIVSANFIPAGMDSVVTLENIDGKKISGNNTSGTDNGFIPVYFSFLGNSITYPPGYAEVYLLGKDRGEVIAIPRTALMELQGNYYVYVVHDGEIYEKRLVVPGADNGENVEILSGLQPGEKYVAKGASIVRMVEMSAVSPEPHTHNH